jgi:hypothetical protein
MGDRRGGTPLTNNVPTSAAELSFTPGRDLAALNEFRIGRKASS